jgi:hypothetical protein
MHDQVDVASDVIAGIFRAAEDAAVQFRSAKPQREQ